MADHGQSERDGYYGIGPGSNTNWAGYHAGQARRAEEEARWNAKPAWGTPQQQGGGQVEAGGLGLLIAFGIACAAIWTARYLLLGLAAGIAGTATLIWLLLPLLGARIGWFPALRQAGLAVVFALLGVAAAGLAAYGVAAIGGPDLIPNMGYVAAGMMSPLDLPANMGAGGWVFPGLAALAAAVWRLDRALPVGGRRPLRWALFAALLLVGPVLGVRTGLALWRDLDPLPPGAFFGTGVPAAVGGMAVAVLAAVLLGALGVALLARAAARPLGARGWALDPRALMRRAGLAYLAYAAALVALLFVFRTGDRLVIGLAEGIAPAGAGLFLSPGALGEFALVQLPAFALFVAVVRGAVAEGATPRRFALAFGAQAALLPVTVAVVAAAWFFFFMVAGSGGA